MVNEAREALRAFVEGREFEGSHFMVEIPDADRPLLRTINGRSHPDIVLLYVERNGLAIYRKNMCVHRDLRQRLIDALYPYIGAPPDESDGAMAHTWGGPLTWLALKAALTNNDEVA